MTNNIDILSHWWETGGLNKQRIDFVVSTVKMVSIYTVTTIPFLLDFDRKNYDIADVTFNIKYIGLWIYYTITYLVIAILFLRSSWKKINLMSSNRDYFTELGLDINTTEGTTIEQMITKTKTTKEEFLLSANRFDNVLIGLEDKNFISTIFFKNFMGTFPLELLFRFVIHQYFFESRENSFKNTDQNSRDFKAYCKRWAIMLLPFIPTLFVFTICNHFLTWVNNGNFLSSYDFNRFAIWKFRYYNEFLINTRRRLDKTKPFVESVMSNLYLENWTSTFSRGLSFLFSVLSVFFIAFSFVGYERFFGIDIIPLIAGSVMLSTMLFTKKHYQESNMTALRTLLKKDLTKYELENYVESKWKILIKECLSVLYFPFLLYFILPDRSYFISNFFNCNVSNGICKFAAWDNKECTVKTKASYYNTSFEMNNSELFVI